VGIVRLTLDGAVDPSTFELFFSILTIAALTGVVVVNGARLLAPRVPVAADVVANSQAVALPLAWIVALTCMLGSLYFSEVANFEPCKLCWFQRVCMYPLALILLIALLRRDRAVRWYAIPLAAIGLPISIYHVLVEHYPNLDKVQCAVANPCSIIWFQQWGFVTLPLMAAAGFAFIITLLALPDAPHDTEDTDEPVPERVAVTQES
jgi:disulfide bond formation protein DsbB